MENPQIIKFTNEIARPTGDAIFALYNLCQKYRALYDASEIQAEIDKDMESFIEDGSAIDGRTRINGLDLYNLSLGVDQLLEFLKKAEGKEPLLNTTAKMARS